jgi:hypothetical protein
VVIAVALLLLAGFLVTRKRRRHVPNKGHETSGPGELDGNGVNQGAPMAAELSAKKLEMESAELPSNFSTPAAAELSAKKPEMESAELSANTPAPATAELASEKLVQPTSELDSSVVTPPPAELQTGQRSATEVPAGSSFMATPPAVSPTDESVDDLVARQAQLEDRRQRLLQLQEIDTEQETIRQRLALLRQQQQPPQRHEMP